MLDEMEERLEGLPEEDFPSGFWGRYENFRDVFMVTGRCDLRAGIDGLCAVLMSLGVRVPPYGVLFLFRGRSAKRIKALCADTDGISMMVNRRHCGQYHWILQPPPRLVRLDRNSYYALMSGIPFNIEGI